jgi:hypothetical protein
VHDHVPTSRDVRGHALPGIGDPPGRETDPDGDLVEDVVVRIIGEAGVGLDGADLPVLGFRVLDP